MELLTDILGGIDVVDVIATGIALLILKATAWGKDKIKGTPTKLDDKIAAKVEEKIKERNGE